MWIYFDTGFVSIVRKGGNRAAPLQVRGRAEGDVERFLLKNPLARRHALPLVITTPEGDYRYRANVSADWVAASLMAISRGILYDNFKSHVASVGTPKAYTRARHYGNVWKASLYLHEAGQREPRGEPPNPKAAASLRKSRAKKRQDATT